MHTKRLIPVGFMLIAITGCVFETQMPVSHSVSQFEAYISETHQTKAHLESGNSIKWDLGDQIGVFSDTEEVVPFTRSGEGNTFVGTKLISGSKYYAFYPYSMDVFDPANPKVLQFKAGGNMTAGGKNPTLNVPMAACSNGLTLAFKQTSGILHIAITGSEQLASVTLHGNKSEPLSMTYTLDLNEDLPTLKCEWDGTSNMVYAPAAAVQLSKTDPYDVYFILPPMTFQDGFSISLGYGGDTVTKFTEKEVNIPRATIVNYTLDVDEYLKQEEEALALERQALVAFYNALDGPNWYDNKNWCSDKPVGEWYGVAIDEYGYVSRLSLSDNNLSGTLPSELSAFKRLRELVIKDSSGSKRIKGSLPDGMTDCVNLAALVFSGVDMSSDLPGWIENLKKLQTLSLDNCNLTGPLPELSSRVISSIELENNQLTGPVPAVYGEYDELGILNLSNNKLSGEVMADFSACSLLVYMNLHGNRLTGPLPKIPVESIHTLYLYDNCFTGPIPEEYARILDNPESDITHIWIHTNNLSGPLPNAILYHPNFSEYADQILRGQREGYKFDFDETKVPACRRVFDTLEGDQLNLGAQYSKSDYTLIVRWAEWCPYAYVFTPEAIELAKKYKSKGLQTIWAYGGGVESERLTYMAESGLDQFSPHIIESYSYPYFDLDRDHAVWRVQRYSTPFAEVVDRDGHILFIDDSGKDYAAYSFSHTRDELSGFLENLLGSGGEDLYESTDYSADGTVHTLQTASKGNGINMVLLGDAYSDRLIADGTYREKMQKAADAFFSEEPFTSHKDHFNVFYIDAVSKNETYEGETAFSTHFGEGTNISGDNEKVYDYVNKVLSDTQMDDALVIVVINRDYYAGTCHLSTANDGDYGRGPAIAYCPSISHIPTFYSIVSHEAGGHGFAKLADEYVSSDETIPEDMITAKYEAMVPYGWWKNIDFTHDPAKVKWSPFISDDRFSEEKIGVFEGACTYLYGVWRPTENSIMRDSLTHFNAPSRYAIWYRIGKLAYGSDWKGAYEDFVTWDSSHRESGATAQKKQSNFVEQHLPPLASPVVETGRAFLK